MGCKEWVQKHEVRPSCTMQPFVKRAVQVPVFLRCLHSQAGGSGKGEVAEPGEHLPGRNAEEIGGLNQHLGIWLLRVMGVKEFGTQRQYSAIQDLIFLLSYKL